MSARVGIVFWQQSDAVSMSHGRQAMTIIGCIQLRKYAASDQADASPPGILIRRRCIRNTNWARMRYGPAKIPKSLSNRWKTGKQSLFHGENEFNPFFLDKANGAQ
jgi:hypothetical protein